MTQSRADRDAELWAFDQMSHEAAQSDAEPESVPVSDRDAQDAREARRALYVEAINRHQEWLAGEAVPNDPTLAREVMAVADAELAPLRARVAELEAERDAARNAHARAIVQLSEWMERAEAAEAALARVTARTDEAALGITIPLSDDDLDLILRALDWAELNAGLRTTQTAYRRLIRTIRAMKGHRHD